MKLTVPLLQGRFISVVPDIYQEHRSRDHHRLHQCGNKLPRPYYWSPGLPDAHNNAVLHPAGFFEMPILAPPDETQMRLNKLIQCAQFLILDDFGLHAIYQNDRRFLLDIIEQTLSGTIYHCFNHKLL
jgi:hypothetical protein